MPIPGTASSNHRALVKTAVSTLIVAAIIVCFVALFSRQEKEQQAKSKHWKCKKIVVRWLQQSLEFQNAVKRHSVVEAQKFLNKMEENCRKLVEKENQSHLENVQKQIMSDKIHSGLVRVVFSIRDAKAFNLQASMHTFLLGAREQVRLLTTAAAHSVAASCCHLSSPDSFSVVPSLLHRRTSKPKNISFSPFVEMRDENGETERLLLGKKSKVRRSVVGTSSNSNLNSNPNSNLNHNSIFMGRQQESEETEAQSQLLLALPLHERVSVEP